MDKNLLGHLINLCQHFQLLNVQFVRERIFGHGEGRGNDFGTPENDLGRPGRRLNVTPDGKIGGAVVTDFGISGNDLGAPDGRLRGAMGKTTRFGQGESRACATRSMNLC